MPKDLSSAAHRTPKPVTQPDQSSGARDAAESGSVLTPIARAVAAVVVHRWWAVVVLAVLVTPAIWPLVRPIAVRQTVAVQLADVAVGTGGLFATWDGQADPVRVVPRGKLETFDAELVIPGRVESLKLRGPTARGRVASASVITSVFGVDAGTRRVRSIASAVIEPDAPTTVAWMRWGGAIGVLTLACVGGVLGVGGVFACVVAQGGASLRGMTIAAWTVVLGAHAWMWLVAPMLFTKDGVAYLDIAQALADGGGLAALDPIRPAGIGLLLAPFVGIDAPLRWTFGTLNALLALAIVWCAWRIARRAAGNAVAVAAIVLVGLDPFLLGFGRTVGTEIPAGACACAAAWLVACRPWGDRAGRDVLCAIGLGALMGCAALMRANLQVLLVLMPVCAGWLVAMRAVDDGEWRRALPAGLARGAVVGAVALGVGVMCIMPVVLHNGRTHGGYALSLFGNTTKFTSLLQTGVVEPSDAGPLDAEAFAAVRDGIAGNSIAFRYEMLALAGAGEGMAEVERVAGEVIARTTQRDPAGVAGTALAAMGVHLGIVPAERVMRTSLSWTVLRPLAGELWRGTPTNFMDEQRARTRLGDAVVDANLRSLRPWRRGVTADLYAALWNGWSVLRPVVGVLALVGGVCLLVRGREGPVLVLGVALAHACALALVAYTPIERYQFPVWPIVVVASLACFAARRGR